MKKPSVMINSRISGFEYMLDLDENISNAELCMINTALDIIKKQIIDKLSERPKIDITNVRNGKDSNS